MYLSTFFNQDNGDATFIDAVEKVIAAGFLGVLTLLIYNTFFHPLSKYPGPWYARASSLPLALISWFKQEPYWLESVARKYGSHMPVRIAPNMLLFPKPSALKDIYREPKLNTKSPLYGTGILGPPHLFSTLDAEEHRALRKALGGPVWSVGSLRRDWEGSMDDLIRLFLTKMREKAEAGYIITLSDKVAEFAADMMTMFSFTEPWGFVENSRDERRMLESWRKGLDMFGLVGRFTFLRDYIMKLPVIPMYLLPSPHDQHGMGYLIGQADRIVSQREEDAANGIKPEKPDFLQYALDARKNGEPLSAQEKRAHATVLIQAGADTTGTGLGSTLRFITTNESVTMKAVVEIQNADKAGKLSHPIKQEETADHLPYIVACIKEGLRLNPPATNLFARILNSEPAMIDGHEIPPKVEVTSNAYVVQRDPELYGPDPEVYRPERWLTDKQKAQEMEANSFVFGIGPRICLGKEIALMELYKLIPEILRNFEIEVIREGQFVVAGGVAYNKEFLVKLHNRSEG